MKEKKQDIEPCNDKGQWHGYQEWYEDGKLSIRVIYKHGLEIGYEEYHNTYYSQSMTNSYIR